ncbi:MAG: hypothetical protein AAF708_16375 [Deinococcota bacterium]
MCAPFEDGVDALAIPTGGPVLEYVLEPPTATATDQDMSRTIFVLERRLQSFGITNPNIQLDDSQIRVQLPNLSDTDLAQLNGLLTQQGKLSFQLVQESVESVETPSLEMLEPSPFQTDIIQRAVISESDLGLVIEFDLAADIRDAFGDFTEANIGRQLAIVFDDEVLTSPTVQARIEASGLISGNFSVEEARIIVAALNSGRLPFALTLVEVRELP